MKAIMVSCGRSMAQIKSDTAQLGDLGLVAEQSRGGQRTMFQPAILTVQGVFKKLREIADITGGSSGNKKVDLIQSLLVACRGSEARYLIRTLAGKLRIGMAEQSVLQALAQAAVQTPLCQDYPPEIHTAYKSVDGEKFKEVLGEESLKLKTASSLVSGSMTERELKFTYMTMGRSIFILEIKKITQPSSLTLSRGFQIV